MNLYDIASRFCRLFGPIERAFLRIQYRDELNPSANSWLRGTGQTSGVHDHVFVVSFDNSLGVLFALLSWVLV